MIVHKWRAGDQAMLAGEPVTIAGFIDHGEPGSLDEVLVELANEEERTVRRDELTSVFDVIQGHWQTCEVYLAGGRLNPSESLAVARHSPTGFGWGDGGSGAVTARPRDPAPSDRPQERGGALPGVQVGRDREAAAGGLLPASRQGARLAHIENRWLRHGDRGHQDIERERIAGTWTSPAQPA